MSNEEEGEQPEEGEGNGGEGQGQGYTCEDCGGAFATEVELEHHIKSDH